MNISAIVIQIVAGELKKNGFETTEEAYEFMQSLSSPAILVRGNKLYVEFFEGK